MGTKQKFGKSGSLVQAVRNLGGKSKKKQTLSKKQTTKNHDTNKIGRGQRFGR